MEGYRYGRFNLENDNSRGKMKKKLWGRKTSLKEHRSLSEQFIEKTKVVGREWLEGRTRLRREAFLLLVVVHSPRLPFRSSLPLLATLRVITSEMKEKRPRARAFPWKASRAEPFYYMRLGRYPDGSQTTFYPEQPRKTGQLVFSYQRR